MNPKILLTGKNGQVGRELNVVLRRFADVVAVGRSELDLSKPENIRQLIRSVQPDIIVNAAAYTAVDRADSEESLAHAINADAPAIMAEEAKALRAALVHYSTDYVFDGTKQYPYVEDDPPSPQNVYGRTKLAGEQAIQQAGSAYLIFRTAWVYAREGRNFLGAVLRLATQKEELTVVDDQIGAPTFSREIASATGRILNDICSRGGKSAQRINFAPASSGIYHMTAAGRTSWYEFAKAILEQVAQTEPLPSWVTKATEHHPLIARRVIPIRTSEYPTPARRPAYSVLSNSRLMRTFGVELPDWRLQLHSAFLVD